MNARLFLTALSLVASALWTASAGAETKIVEVEVQVDSQWPGYEGYRAMDGDAATMWHTDFQFNQTTHPHELYVDLGASYEISGFVYVPRSDMKNGTIGKYEFYLSNNQKNFGKPIASGEFDGKSPEMNVTLPAKVKARYVKLRALSEIAGRPWTSIAELQIQVDGVTFRAKQSSPESLITADELSMQFAELQRELQSRAHFARVGAEAYNAQANIWESDRDPLDVVLRRTAALLDDLQKSSSPPELAALEKELAALTDAGKQVDVQDIDARRELFEKVCVLRRKIAFSNPLLNFDKILFLKRHRATFNHMCDQYYGVNARPGGGLCVLSDPFGAEPQLRDLTSDLTVQSGRLSGKKLTGGSFLSPDLSFDAKRIAFAYVECEGDTAHRYHTDPSQGHWHEGRCYHLFSMNIDGSNLRQLTDGTWNDFDPCWLPNGRLAFITERRNGYLRCGRVCPTYTLFDVGDDGGNMRCLSYHETNEWHPSVAHDGSILYTRWDYVDRHGCTAHMPWVTTVDGRDSRAIHGNFAPRGARPDMELDCRAIPGSQKFVATAAPHHGQAFGSLVVVDSRIPDDDKMAPVARLTPEVGFPETQGGAQVYGTPWPLSETYHLCAYDVQMQPGMGGQGGHYQRGNYGLYLVDAFGNKELIYRDASIACQNPVPLAPRTMPPNVSETVVRQDQDQPYVKPTVANKDEPEPEATVAVLDVYDSLKPWPAGTNITALRVVQVLPMTVPSGQPPHEIGHRLPSGLDSVILARSVLGTVPVEKDGSIHFKVPAHKEIYFQALDERGLAVQSMRSSTYLQAGERMVCAGCHEKKHQAPQRPEKTPLALLREPSKLQADVDGSKPFSYARLVQPVLDRHCVGCHAEHPDTAMNLAREPIQNKWFASYVNLTKEHSFRSYGEDHRTTPGKFGAHASKLLKLLDEGHHDVKLSDEEFHRITLWLDMCSVFYGVYEKEGGEAQLRGEVVYPTLE